MAFQTNPNFNNANTNNNGEAPKKKNIRVAKIDTDDGRLNITVWRSDRGGIYVVLNMMAAAGKDPQTGRVMYEQRMPNELPSIYMTASYALGLLDAINMQKCNEAANLNFQYKVRDNVLNVSSEGTNIKMTLESPKTGSRNMTFQGMQVGTGVVHPTWHYFQKMLKMAVDKVLYARLDPDEFNVNTGADDVDETSPW